MPYVLTGTGPGDLFVVRNVGNLIPPHEASVNDPGLGAAIEFAVLKLKVRDVVICGHSHCGAVRALYEDPAALADTPSLVRWLETGTQLVLRSAAMHDRERRSAFLREGREGAPLRALEERRIDDDALTRGEDGPGAVRQKCVHTVVEFLCVQTCTRE